MVKEKTDKTEDSIVEGIEGAVEKGLEAVEDVVEEVIDKVKGKKSANENKGKRAVEEMVAETKEKVEAEMAEDEKKLAKAESLETEKETPAKKAKEKKVEKTLEERKKELLENVAKLKEKVSAEGISTEDLKREVKIKKRTDMLIPLEDYVKSGIYIGTRAVTPNMKKFVYRRRADGLAIFNTDLIDEKLKEGIEYLSKFNAEDVILVCKREAGWKVAQKFSQLTGIRVFTKKYPAGILTNTDLRDFFENELTIVVDSWLDRNALADTLNVNKKILMVCDTNNFSQGADKVIIGNNKAEKSLGVIFYLLTRGYMKAKDMDTTGIPDLEWWTGEDQEGTGVAKAGGFRQGRK